MSVNHVSVSFFVSLFVFSAAAPSPSKKKEESFPFHAAQKAAVAAARGAGDLLREYWSSGREKSIEFKSATDLVTEADKKAEMMIMSALTASFPDWSFLCEESGASGDDQESEYRWIVDPLDGTTSFAHGHPFFSVSIALEHRGEVVLGVVYAVVMDEMFVAQRGSGATVNGVPIHCSSTPRLIEALVATGFPTARAQMTNRLDTNFAYFEEVLLNARACRRNGSAALDLCYVACGRMDVYWEQGLKAWDVAAGALILSESGGKFTDMDGTEISFRDAASEDDKFNVLGTNGHLHQTVIDTFAKVRQEHAGEKK